jgi:multidrug efflux system outer membrane protein
MRRYAALMPLALAACSLAPKYVRPELPVPPSWPAGDPYLRQTEAALPAITYPQVFRDPRLQQVIAQALANNRDLRIAVANIEQARALYRVQRAAQFPQLDANQRTQRQGGSQQGAFGGFSQANISVSAFEIDLFGRVASLTGAALNRYFAQEAAARATRLTLVGDVAEAWLTYAADRSLLRLRRIPRALPSEASS